MTTLIERKIGATVSSDTTAPLLSKWRDHRNDAVFLDGDGQHTVGGRLPFIVNRAGRVDAVSNEGVYPAVGSPYAAAIAQANGVNYISGDPAPSGDLGGYAFDPSRIDASRGLMLFLVAGAPNVPGEISFATIRQMYRGTQLLMLRQSTPTTFGLAVRSRVNGQATTRTLGKSAGFSAIGVCLDYASAGYRIDNFGAGTSVSGELADTRIPDFRGMAGTIFDGWLATTAGGSTAGRIAHFSVVEGIDVAEYESRGSRLALLSSRLSAA